MSVKNKIKKFYKKWQKNTQKFLFCLIYFIQERLTIKIHVSVT